MKRGRIRIFCICTAMFIPVYAQATIRFPHEDAVVVDRSELILVARLKPGSIQYVPHEKNAYGSRTWEHHAILSVTEVIKGRCEEKEIPIVIAYGLTPIIGGCFQNEHLGIDRRGPQKDYPKDIVEIVDSADGPRSPLVKDARDDNLWFLRRIGPGDTYHRDILFRIADPEDLRPLSLKEYFLAYLSKDPEPQVRNYLSRNKASPVARSAQRFLDHLETQRTLKQPEAAKRLAGLMPYFARDGFWDGTWEARNGIVACGKVAGPALLNALKDPQYARLGPDIICILNQISYREAAPVLVSLLRSRLAFWDSQKLFKGKWFYGEDGQPDHKRQRMGSEVCEAVRALREFRETSAVDVVKETKKQWSRDGFKNNDILDACDRFLKVCPEPGHE